MARAKGVKATLTTSEARRVLPQLVRDAAQQSRPGKSLRENAVQIQPRGEEGSAYLVPEVDLEAAERRIEALEEELEDIGLMRMLEQRMRVETGALTDVDDVIREFGFDELTEAPSWRWASSPACTGARPPRPPAGCESRRVLDASVEPSHGRAEAPGPRAGISRS